jgi:hypothetical protein
LPYRVILTFEPFSTMKIDRRRAPFAVLLLATIVASEGIIQGSDLARRDPLETTGDARAGPVGTEHAPVDGKDGMPHEGPWVETETDRKNRKLSEVDEESADFTSDKTVPAKDLPQSNDGVMDDPNRIAPDAGTRGIDGGVTQRTKSGASHGKEPEQPKEIPPLPHSEKQKLDLADGDESEFLTDKVDADKQKFEVRQTAHKIDRS